MSADERTIAFYDAEARAYAAAEHQYVLLQVFIAETRPGGSVLDLGCGAGAHAAALRAQGFAVTAIDRSAGLAAEAKRLWDVDVRLADFSSLDVIDAFDGVWASASLHHAPANDLPGIFAAVHRSMKANGSFHATVKAGAHDRRDALGRFFCAMNEDTLAALAAHWRSFEIERHEGPGYDGEITPWLWLRARR